MAAVDAGPPGPITRGREKKKTQLLLISCTTGFPAVKRIYKLLLLDHLMYLSLMVHDSVGSTEGEKKTQQRRAKVRRKQISLIHEQLG